MGKNIDDLNISDSNYDSPSGKLPMIKKSKLTQINYNAVKIVDSATSSQTPGSST
jgi:hypothetical protein